MNSPKRTQKAQQYFETSRSTRRSLEQVWRRGRGRRRRISRHRLGRRWGSYRGFGRRRLLIVVVSETCHFSSPRKICLPLCSVLNWDRRWWSLWPERLWRQRSGVLSNVSPQIVCRQRSWSILRVVRVLASDVRSRGAHPHAIVCRLMHDVGGLKTRVLFS